MGVGSKIVAVLSTATNSCKHLGSFCFFLYLLKFSLLGRVWEEHHDLGGDPGPPNSGRARPGTTRPDPARATPSGRAKPCGLGVRVRNALSIPYSSHSIEHGGY